jgi:hypothetical protein
MFRTFSPEAFLWLVQAPISPRRKGAGLCGPIARHSSAADAMKRLILASKAPFSLMSPRPRGNVLIATVIAHYQGTYQPQVPTTGRAFTAALAALLTPLALTTSSRGVLQMLRSIAWIAASLLVCLSAGHCRAGTLSGSKRAVATSCAKTISFRRTSSPFGRSSFERRRCTRDEKKF